MKTEHTGYVRNVASRDRHVPSQHLMAVNYVGTELAELSGHFVATAQELGVLLMRCRSPVYGVRCSRQPEGRRNDDRRRLPVASFGEGPPPVGEHHHAMPARLLRGGQVQNVPLVPLNGIGVTPDDVNYPHFAHPRRQRSEL